MWLSLLLSFVCANGMHLYLLHSQRNDRKMSISYHAVHSRKTYIVYILGHFFGGLFFLIFAYRLFYVEFGSETLWTISVLGVVSEWIQAITPAKNKYEIYHLVAAWSMALFMSILLFVSPIVAKDMAALMVAIATFLTSAVLLVDLKKQKFWIPQITFFLLFFAVMTLLAI